MENAIQYEEFDNVDQYANLVVMLTQKESEHFRAEVDLELATATGDSTADRKATLDRLTIEVKTLQEKLAALPPLNDDQKGRVEEVKQGIRMQRRPTGPPGATRRG